MYLDRVEYFKTFNQKYILAGGIILGSLIDLCTHLHWYLKVQEIFEDDGVITLRLRNRVSKEILIEEKGTEYISLVKLFDSKVREKYSSDIKKLISIFSA